MEWRSSAKRGSIRWLLACALVACAPWASAQEKPAAIDVLHYAARLQPNLTERTLRGQVTITLRVLDGDHRAIEFDSGELSIDAVREAGAPLAFTRDGKRLRIELLRPADAGARRVFEIDYHGTPRFGLEFHPERAQLYTIFSTSQWLVVIDAPADRATLSLDVVLPAGLQAVGNGRALRVRRLDDGRELHRWRQRTPVPSYTFGFAAGRFTQVDARARNGVPLRYLGDGFDQDELRRIFADTGDMLDWFARRAGVRYPGERYDQALVAKTIGQEHAGFALLSEAHGRRVLADPADQALIAHEAAHQWWGNAVTCANWNHFWLNEGFANFMAAAYLQHRIGEAAYAQQVEGWRTRLARLRAEGKDKPLVFPDWNQPSGDDRAVVYQKGAYVLYLLREQLGERAFWAGIRAYTRSHIGQPVLTTDFQRAMERASGRDLSAFFAEWVDPAS